MKLSTLTTPAALSLTFIFIASGLTIKNNSQNHEKEILNKLTEINGDTASYPKGLIFSYKSNATPDNRPSNANDSMKNPQYYAVKGRSIFSPGNKINATAAYQGNNEELCKTTIERETDYWAINKISEDVITTKCNLKPEEVPLLKKYSQMHL